MVQMDTGNLILVCLGCSQIKPDTSTAIAYIYFLSNRISTIRNTFDSIGLFKHESFVSVVYLTLGDLARLSNIEHVGIWI